MTTTTGNMYRFNRNQLMILRATIFGLVDKKRKVKEKGKKLRGLHKENDKFVDNTNYFSQRIRDNLRYLNLCYGFCRGHKYLEIESKNGVPAKADRLFECYKHFFPSHGSYYIKSPDDFKDWILGEKEFFTSRVDCYL